MYFKLHELPSECYYKKKKSGTLYIVYIMIYCFAVSRTSRYNEFDEIK
jgi:hypothetical protein